MNKITNIPQRLMMNRQASQFSMGCILDDDTKGLTFTDKSKQTAQAILSHIKTLFRQGSNWIALYIASKEAAKAKRQRCTPLKSRME